MTVSLVTLGDPDIMTGGYLYHRRLADMAPELTPSSLRQFPTTSLPFSGARPPCRRVCGASEADVIVVHSIAAAFWGRPRLRTPAVGMAHQAPGGIDHGALRSSLQGALATLAFDEELRGRLGANERLCAPDLRDLEGHRPPLLHHP
jgi:hypothetical protein